MTHFLRDRRNRTLVDIETTPADLKVRVHIGAYSALLLSSLEQFGVVADFVQVQDLRGRFFEGNRKPNETPEAFVRRHLKKVATKYQMSYEED